MYNIFHISLLEQDTTRNGQRDENVTQLEFKSSNSKKYKVEAIWKSAIYKKKLELDQLPRLYYLIL